MKPSAKHETQYLLAAATLVIFGAIGTAFWSCQEGSHEACLYNIGLTPVLAVLFYVVVGAPLALLAAFLRDEVFADRPDDDTAGPPPPRVPDRSG